MCWVVGSACCQRQGRANTKGYTRSKYLECLGWQAAFLFGNATVWENILFGEPFDEARYNEAIDAAALLPDLMRMPGVVSSSELSSFLSMNSLNMR